MPTNQNCRAMHRTTVTTAASSLDAASTGPNRWLLCAELALVFAVLPALMYKKLLPNWPIPILLAVTAGALFIARRFRDFSYRRLFDWSRVEAQAAGILKRDALLMAGLGIVVWRFAPDMLFSLVRRAPVLWAAVMLLYPVFSALPQEFLFRAYFFRRYQTLFGKGPALIAASGVAFGFVHIIFGNWLAVLLSAIGGLLFASTYARTASLSLVCLEHALFGDFLFTIGLGRFFYHGRGF
jgi:CAAX protease family protein